MSDADPIITPVEQAMRIAKHHPELAATYLAAIREKTRGMKPEELDRLLGDLPKVVESSRS